MKYFFLLLLGFSLSGCHILSFDENSYVESSLIVRSGESFGFCVGYCRHELELTDEQMRIFSTSWVSDQHPDRMAEASIDEEKWNEIQAMINLEAFGELDDLYGCPDCADGGSEWIEIQADSVVKRVTFEYRNAPSEIGALADTLRELRESMKKRNFPE